jgi:hypothetical protein
MTPFPEDIFKIIQKYSNNLFTSEIDLKRFCLNEMDEVSGTKIFLIDLKSLEGFPEIIADRNDIRVN